MNSSDELAVRAAEAPAAADVTGTSAVQDVLRECWPYDGGRVAQRLHALAHSGSEGPEMLHLGCVWTWAHSPGPVVDEELVDSPL